MNLQTKRAWLKKNYQHVTSVILIFTAFFTSAVQAATCTYTVTNEWNSGFQGSITILNSGTTAINAWNVEWRYSANKITNSWNANLSGSNPYKASNVDWNKSIQPGQSISFGIQGDKNNNAVEKPIITGSICSTTTSSTSSAALSVSSFRSSSVTNSSVKSSAVSSVASSINSSVIFSASVKSISSTASSISTSVTTGQQCNWYGTLYPLYKTTASGCGMKIIEAVSQQPRVVGCQHLMELLLRFLPYHLFR